MFKAWNTATPAQLSGSLLLLVKTKQIICQDMVGYCFFRPLLSLRSMAVLVASPLVRPARQNRHATQATHCLTTTLSFDIRCVGNKIHIVKSCTLRRVRKMIIRGTQPTKPIFIMILIFKIFASASKLFPGGYSSGITSRSVT